MKGYGATVSPFTRKVRVAAIETGQHDLIDWEMVVIAERPAALAENNPLDKVPVVILDDGRRLYDSPVICEYLDSLHDGPKLIPMGGEARWEALRLQALGDGVCDAAVLHGAEMRRPEAFRYQPFIERQVAKMAKRDPSPRATVFSDGLKCFTAVTAHRCAHHPIATGSGPSPCPPSNGSTPPSAISRTACVEPTMPSGPNTCHDTWRCSNTATIAATDLPT